MGASIISIPVLGEKNLPAVYWVGVILGCLGIWLIASSNQNGGGQILGDLTEVNTPPIENTGVTVTQHNTTTTRENGDI